MPIDWTDLAPYLLFAAFLVVGLLAYERRGLRLGGVVVLPLLLVYALFDLQALAVFTLATVLVLLLGHWLHHRTLVYGRRLFILYLLLSVAATALVKVFIGTTFGPFTIAILPGLFAYNLHREGDYARGLTAFSLWLAGLLMVGLGILWATGLRDPPSYFEPAVAAISHLGSQVAASLPHLTSVVDQAAGAGAVLFSGFHGLAEGPLPAATASAAVAMNLGPWDGDAE